MRVTGGAASRCSWPALACDLVACVCLLAQCCCRLVGVHYGPERGWLAACGGRITGLGTNLPARTPPLAWAPPYAPSPEPLQDSGPLASPSSQRFCAPHPPSAETPRGPRRAGAAVGQALSKGYPKGNWAGRACRIIGDTDLRLRRPECKWPHGASREVGPDSVGERARFVGAGGGRGGELGPSRSK